MATGLPLSGCGTPSPPPDILKSPAPRPRPRRRVMYCYRLHSAPGFQGPTGQHTWKNAKATAQQIETGRNRG
ncbi:Os04g0690451 [Oryza sativa Japonica Group]|uniref:Os04g0690451 protein n=1 Tax=Oryza sativa subsp. japonica TaxID=39947 RepID=A0A0P0WGN8_ORYSJ|nr:hypothetical protein EE612_026422 [Oryza sativa]BAS91772.1 Os04g0690451 [Oryza sativa Japonica Group]